jgi:hypothetical protein
MSGLLDSVEGPVDVALVQVLREHFTADDRSAPAWFRASGDPHVGSEFAFAAAFKRHHGAAPGRWRTAKRAAA